MWVQSLGQKDPLLRTWQPTRVFLPAESNVQRILTGDIHGVSKSLSIQTHAVLCKGCLQICPFSLQTERSFLLSGTVSTFKKRCLMSLNLSRKKSLLTLLTHQCIYVCSLEVSVSFFPELPACLGLPKKIVPENMGF